MITSENNPFDLSTRREEAVARLPRAPQLAPVPGLAPIDAKDRGDSDEMFDNWALRALEPERLGPPPATRSHRDNLLRAHHLDRERVHGADRVLCFRGLKARTWTANGGIRFKVYHAVVNVLRPRRLPDDHCPR